MKNVQLLWGLIILFGCTHSGNEHAETPCAQDSFLETGNIKDEQLPFCATWKHLFIFNYHREMENKDTVWRWQPDGDFYLVLRNTLKARPVLYTRNKKTGVTIDTLPVFDKECFIGVDSDYTPWLEIDENLIVSWADTSYYSRIVSVDNPATSKDYELLVVTDTSITGAVYQIDGTGKFKTIQPSNYPTITSTHLEMTTYLHDGTTSTPNIK